MRFNAHSDLSGRHAILSPSYGHWLNYDDLKLANRLRSTMASIEGTKRHDLAHTAIEMGIYLARPTPEEQAAGIGNPLALALYVEDGINMGMSCEVPLFYSENCFGHADTLDFDEDELHLQIHDYKNGLTPAKPSQLDIYGAIFCLEYEVDPTIITWEFRIYQAHEEPKIFVPPLERIINVMDSIVEKDEKLKQMKEDLRGRHF